MRPRPAVHRVAARASLATTVAVLAATAVPAPAAAKTRHAPCPTAGTTLYRSSKYDLVGLRVYRVGTALRSCTRSTGKRRRIRSLGVWTPATKVAVGGGFLAWTTRGTAADGTAADTVRTTNVPTGRRALTVTRTAVATGPTIPATPDTVVALQTDGLATAWVTTGGRLAVAVALPKLVPPTEPDENPVFHDGAIYAVRDVGAALAPALAKGITFVDASETDDCGGTISRILRIPAVGDAPAGVFEYLRQAAKPSKGCN
ncbi:hypothetical protein [Patulibacter sp.]|uniref:hypothetical protein n=1 Tax=Patulibacter sp. TaxID=1912859 RepID=UPI00271B1EE5|nr:hypothetical protein [Patulibacter sp.]MDO9407597.1 hypothetical protein [Patulibacter sp.]